MFTLSKPNVVLMIRPPNSLIRFRRKYLCDIIQKLTIIDSIYIFLNKTQITQQILERLCH